VIVDVPTILLHQPTFKIMRKIFNLFFIPFFVITLISCTADTDDIIQVKLVKKIIEVNQDGTSSIINFTYEDKKINSIESEEIIKTFYYTGSLITKIIELNKTTQFQKISDYIYTNDFLTKVISSDHYTLNYNYKSDGTITYEKTRTDTNNNIVLVWQGTMSVLSNNVIENNKTLETSGNNILEKEELSFTYDIKSNPLRNIAGFNKLLDYSGIISKNNITSFFKVNSTAFLDSDEHISSLVEITKRYNYDKEGYPKEVISTKPVFGKEDENHLKTLYFY
jgi:hypothetical protein